MHKPGLSWLTAAWLCGVAVEPANASDLDTSIALPPSAKISVKIQVTDKNTRGTTVYTTTRVTSFQQTVTPSSDGYRVEEGRQTVKTQPDSTPGLDKFAERQGDRDPVVYLADRSLMPLSVLQMTYAVPPRTLIFASDGTAIAEGVNAPSTLTDQPISKLGSRLDWIRRVAPIQQVKLDLNKPLASTSLHDDSDPLMPDIPLNTTIELKSIDAKTGKATVVTKSAYDPAEAATAAARYVENARKDPFWSGKQSAPAVGVAKLKVDFSETCTFNVDTRTGLVTSTDCTSRDMRPNPSLYQWVTETRTRITQTLVR